MLRSPTLPLIANLGLIQPQGGPLFRLPREVRELIWKECTTTHVNPNSLYDKEEPRHHVDREGRLVTDTAVLLTCRAIYAEAWDLPIRQTTLVIHEGAEEDKPIRTQPGTQLLCTHAWQVLLLEHIDMTFQQDGIDGNGIEQWLGFVGVAKRAAYTVVEELFKERNAPDHDENLRKALLKSKGIMSITVRMNRRDWSAWRSPIVGSGAAKLHLELVAKPQRILRVDSDTLHHDTTLELVLETFAIKESQLKEIVEKAKQCHFLFPTTREGFNFLYTKMAWDGKIGDDRFKTNRADPTLAEVFAWPLAFQVRAAFLDDEATRTVITKRIKFVRRGTTYLRRQTGGGGGGSRRRRSTDEGERRNIRRQLLTSRPGETSWSAIP